MLTFHPEPLMKVNSCKVYVFHFVNLDNKGSNANAFTTTAKIFLYDSA